jgi:hypothetical protein
MKENLDENEITHIQISALSTKIPTKDAKLLLKIWEDGGERREDSIVEVTASFLFVVRRQTKKKVGCLPRRETRMVTHTRAQGSRGQCILHLAHVLTCVFALALY